MTDVVGPLGVRQPLGQEPADAPAALWVLALVAIAAVVCVACFPFATEGVDGAARIALALRWLNHPTLISTQDCSQYGPLSVCAVIGILSVWKDPYLAPRLVSLLFGIAAVVPLFLITRLLFNRRAAIMAGLFFASDSLLVKSSGTTMAEAPFVFLFLFSVYFVFRFRRTGRLFDLLSAAFLLTGASMVRYEGWLFIPLMGLLVIRPSTGEGNGWRRVKAMLAPVLVFGAVASALPLLWLLINYVKLGDPWGVWRWLRANHALHGVESAQRRGVGGALAYSAIFPFVVLLLSLSPGVLFLALAGMRRAIARRQTLLYAALFLPFMAYFVETLALRTYPVARFWLLPGLLLLPYAGSQMDACCAGVPRALAVRRTAWVVLSAAVVFGALTAAAWLEDLPFHQKFWSVAPVSPLLPEDKKVFDLIRGRMKPGDKLVQDSSPCPHVLVFYLSPAIRENWWDRPALDGLATPQARREYLEASAPGFAVLDAGNADLPRLLNVPPQRIPDFSGIKITQIYSSPKYTVYELAPKADGHWPR